MDSDPIFCLVGHTGFRNKSGLDPEVLRTTETLLSTGSVPVVRNPTEGIPSGVLHSHVQVRVEGSTSCGPGKLFLSLEGTRRFIYEVVFPAIFQEFVGKKVFEVLDFVLRCGLESRPDRGSTTIL